MKAVLLSVIIFYGAYAELLGLGLNEKCRNETEPWTCKKHSQCEGLKKGIEIRTLDICSFMGKEPVICCPPSVGGNNATARENKGLTGASPRLPKALANPGEKAEQKCREYGQYVYTVVNSPILLPGVGKTKINECGMAAQKLIVGGTPAEPKEFPHMALIGYGERPNIEWLCGGSLISPKFVLSAAHCTIPNSRPASWVRLGDLDILSDRDEARPVEVKIKNRINHPQYNSRLLYHDIALYELESEVKFGRYIRPLCLQSTRDIDSKTALASGWGLTQWEGRRSSMLQKVNLTIISNEQCKRKLEAVKHTEELPNSIDDDLMLCAGGEAGKDICQGDSGGPLQIVHKSVYCMYSQVGVVSLSKACALGYPAVFTRVSNYLPWIESIVWP